MNSQDFRNLQEAYMDVYELDEMFGLGKKKRKSPRADAIINSPEFKKRMEDADKIAVQNLKDMMSGDKKRQNRVAMHPDNRTDLNDYKEEVDLYDIILSHLLDEGYADTEDSALVIMANMSEDWRESIVEDYKPWDFGPKQKAKRKYDQLVKDKAAGNSPPGTATRANKIASVAKDMRTTLDKNSASTGTNPAKQGLQPATQRHTAAALRGAGGGMTASKVYDVKQLNRR